MLLDESDKKPKGFLSHKPLLIFIWAVLPILVVFGITWSTSNPNSDELFGNQSILAISLAQIFSVTILLIIPALLIAYVYKKEVFSFLNLQKAPSLQMVLVVCGIVLSANFFLNYLMDLNEMIPLSEGLQTKFQSLHESTTKGQEFFLNFNGAFEFVIVFITMAVFPAIAEEMYFRGLLIGILADLKINAFYVIFITSILFAMMHFQFYFLLPLLFMGGMLGYIYYRTKNLWLSIIAHLFNNGLIVVLTLTNKTNISNIDLEANPPIFVSIIGLSVFCALLFLFHKKTKLTKF